MPEPYIIADTPHALVLNKPAGLITHSDGRTTEPSLAEWIGEHYPAMRGVGGAWISPQGEHVALNGLVHRLDRATSGVIIAAKNQETFDSLKEDFKAKRVEKIYHALVYGHLEGEGRIVAEIARTNILPKRWYAKPTDIDDKRAAITEWKVLKNIGDTVTLLELRPRTGRTHQLRVHLASVGHPIVGDALYGAEDSPIADATRLALHAYQISFECGGERYTYVAPSPFQ